MTAFDTDILSDLIGGRPAVVTRAAGIPEADRGVPVTAAVETLRGWMAAIRRAEAGQGRIRLEVAYGEFSRTLTGLTKFQVIPYTAAADFLYQSWRKTIRIGANDLRIGAICVAHSITLVTRNARDFNQVPGLKLDVWP